ncbi:MAG: crossover junction endodeoxyribonuclease RuvC [Candidatus Latescibacterota bacterium]
MLVLGVDPGLGTTGYALVENRADGPRLIEAGVITSKPSHSLERRLLELYSSFESIIDEYRPQVVAIEELYSHYEHPKTAVVMGHARGVFFLLAGKAGIPVCSYSATRIKKSLTGVGHATKEQVALMLARILRCDPFGGPADVTDAVATALCHINAISHGGEL